jgi:hypothetical protein
VKLDFTFVMWLVLQFLFLNNAAKAFDRKSIKEKEKIKGKKEKKKKRILVVSLLFYGF